MIAQSIVGALPVLMMAASVNGQGTKADYERSAHLRQLTENTVFRQQFSPHWFDGDHQFWYRVGTGPNTHEFVLVDVEKGNRQPAFDHDRLAAAWTKALGKDVRADRLPIDDLQFDTTKHSVDIRGGGKWWRCDLKTYAISGIAATDKTSAAGENHLHAFEDGPKRSKCTGDDTTVTFVNHSQAEVELWWLDEQGKRHSYGTLAAGESRDQNTYAGHVWLVEDGKGHEIGIFEADEHPATVDIPSTRAGIAKKTRNSRPRTSSNGLSPDGKWQAFIENHNVSIKSVGSGESFSLSGEGTEGDEYRGPFYWSPDSSRLVVVRRKAGDEHLVYFIESSPPGHVQPVLHSHQYPKPGDKIAVDKPQLFDVAGKKHMPVSDELFPQPWSVEDIRWDGDSQRFTFVYNQRGHQVLRLLAVDAATGAARAIIDESSKTFIDYSGKYFLHYLDGTREIIWMSERDGWNHLYLYDADTGKVKNKITAGDWVVRGVDRVDPERREIWFRAGGIRPGQDPYYIHYCRVKFDGSGLVVLTEGDGTHSIEYSPDGRTFLDRYSRVDMPPVSELRRTEDGRKICELERADWTALLAKGWQAPERFAAKGRDGATDIFGVIFRPMHFDARKKYPVVEAIYAGPQDSFVPKGFRTSYSPQAMSELGFVVVQIDGMGTSNRSKKFHDVCWKNLADAGLPDRILWIKAAAAKYPCMDPTRVGIYGGSAGGQNAAGAVMTHGDFYKVAVADCGCHDNRMDKIWWNEQWMGWPIGPEYAANSNVTLAKGLQGKLLLMVGEMDTNVDPASTMQVVNALIKADKDFEMLVIPGSDHGSAESPYGRRRRADFLVRNLLGVEPRSR